MPNVLITRFRTDGSGKKRTYPVKINVWHKSVLNGSNGPQPHWYLIAVAPDARETLGRASIYEDRNPHRLLRKCRLYRWDVFPTNGEGYSYARGECVSLAGAKLAAEACSKLMAVCKPYREKVHKR